MLSLFCSDYVDVVSGSGCRHTRVIEVVTDHSLISTATLPNKEGQYNWFESFSIFNVLRVSCCGNYISLSKKYVKYIPRSIFLDDDIDIYFFFYIFIRARRGTKTYRNRQSYCMYSSQKAQTKSKTSNTLYNTTIVSFREKIPRETVSVNR